MKTGKGRIHLNLFRLNWTIKKGIHCIEQVALFCMQRPTWILWHYNRATAAPTSCRHFVHSSREKKKKKVISYFCDCEITSKLNEFKHYPNNAMLFTHYFFWWKKCQQVTVIQFKLNRMVSSFSNPENQFQSKANRWLQRSQLTFCPEPAVDFTKLFLT